jgi:hypothetical protein
MVALLERNYRTHSAAQRPMRAAAEIQQIEWAGTINEKNNLAGPELWQFLRGVFDQLENALATEAKADKGRLVNLGQWLNNQIEKSRISLEELTPAFRWLDNQIKEDWQNLEAFVSAEELTLAFRMRSTSVVRGKLIRLTTEIIQQTIILAVQLNPKSEKDTNIIVEVSPQRGQPYLPEALQVRVLDDQQKAVMEAIASSTNRNIQFDFDVASGEHFSVQMVLGGTSVTEEFVM